MEVKVKLHYFLREYAPEGDYKRAFSFDVDDDSTVRDLISALGMEPEEKIVFVDNKRSDNAVILKEGANIKIFPPIVGG